MLMKLTLTNWRELGTRISFQLQGKSLPAGAMQENVERASATDDGGLLLQDAVGRIADVSRQFAQEDCLLRGEDSAQELRFWRFMEYLLNT